jgi:hypothetical protein
MGSALVRPATSGIVFVACLAAALAGVAAGQDEAFPLLDGNRRATLVGTSRFLRYAVERCAGVQLAQVPEDRFQEREDAFPVYLGDTRKAREVLSKEIADLDIEGYVLLATPRFVVIYAGTAKTDTGDPQAWAEADFARRALGADQYFAGELGQVFPKCDRALVPCFRAVENPAFKHRQWSGYSGSAGPAWRVRASGGGGRYRFHHNLWRIVTPDMFKDHPEYFPVRHDAKQGRFLDGGRRYSPAKTPAAYWQPCTSHPDVLRLTVRAVLDAFAREPAVRSFSLGINDSAGFCNCPDCLKNTPAGEDPHAAAANAYRIYGFYNQVAEQVAAAHPDARLGFLVYSDLNARLPDRLHPALMPWLTLSFADCWDAAYRDRLYAHVDRWGRAAGRIGIYEWLHGQGFLIPRIYSHSLAEGLRRTRQNGAEGFYAEAYANWGLDGPKLWIAEKLAWDPSQDVDALIDRWCEALFEDAAKPMRAYFDFLEAAWTRQKPSDDRRGGYRMMGAHLKAEQFTAVFPPETVDAAWALLDQARAAAGQEAARKRVDFFRDTFAVTRAAVRRFHAAQALEALQKAEDARGAARRPMTEWLQALDAWAVLPAVDDCVDDLRRCAPLALQDLCVEEVQGRESPAKRTRASFAEWDTDAPALRAVVERTVREVMESKPSSRSELGVKVISLLKLWGDQAEREGRPCPAAVAVVRPLATACGVDAGRLASAPVIDGEIEAAWGDPCFDGRFYAYPYETRPADERTRVWFGLREGKVFVAFHCHQPPEGVLDALPGRDDVRRTPAGRVDLGGLLPYLSGVDSVGVSLPDASVVIVTAAGGLFDARPTPTGYVTDWNGARAAVKRAADGWRAEIEIECKDCPFLNSAGPLSPVNFFRVRGDRRSAWTPAQPRRWGVYPGRGGYVFLRP